MENNSSSGLGLGMVLFIVFLILKLTDNIDWSWWWVTSPIWIPIDIGVLFILLIKLSDLQMKKEELYEKLMRAIMLIEDGAPHMAKRILEELANKVTFLNKIK